MNLKFDLGSMKTTICALIGALAGFVAFTPQHFSPIVVDLAKYVMIGGFAAVGILAKDSNDHSTAAEVIKATAKKSAETLPPGTTLNLQATAATPATPPTTTTTPLANPDPLPTPSALPTSNPNPNPKSKW